MKTLLIKDLPLSETLDREAMRCVVGGMYRGSLSHQNHQFNEHSRRSFSFEASQRLNQHQKTLISNGNNVAFASDVKSSDVPVQNGSNMLNLG